jgi:AraC family ethanolamine operon transcriptional activator
MAAVLDLRVSSAEEMEAARAREDVRYAQLGTGRCQCRLVAVETAHVQLRYEAWSLGLLRTGRAPREAVTFLVALSRCGSVRIQGQPAGPGEVLVLLPGEESDCRSTGPAQIVSVTIERAALEERVRALLDRHFGELRLQGRLHGLRADADLLRGICIDVAARASARPRLLRDAAFVKGVEAKLVKALFAGLGPPANAETPCRRRALAWRAEALLRQNLAEPPKIAHLCHALDVSERTLHEVFREHLDTTPKVYLKTLRLNAARHDLVRARDTTRVTDVALDWGFLHFGWFSQDYRRLFGETPRQTLERGRGDRADGERSPSKRGPSSPWAPEREKGAADRSERAWMTTPSYSTPALRA